MLLPPPHSHTSTRLDSDILQYVPQKKNQQILNAPTVENIVSLRVCLEAIFVI